MARYDEKESLGRIIKAVEAASFLGTEWGVCAVGRAIAQDGGHSYQEAEKRYGEVTVGIVVRINDKAGDSREFTRRQRVLCVLRGDPIPERAHPLAVSKVKDLRRLMDILED